MIIYRLTGRAEQFPNCGLLLIAPLVDSSLTRIKKSTQAYIRKTKKAGLGYDIWLEKVWIKAPSIADIIEMLSTEDTGILIEKTERLNSWSV